MTTLPAATMTGSTYRSAGRPAIASGVFGLMAIGCLAVAVNVMFLKRPELFGLMELMFKTHHVGVILQSLFMIPVVFGLQTLARQRIPGVSRATRAVGIVSLSLTYPIWSILLGRRPLRA